MSSTEAEWDFVCEVSERLAKRANDDGIESLTPAEQVVVWTRSASGIIGNGGFTYYYEGATETLEVAAAFDTLGLHDAAEACRAAHAIVPAEVITRGFGACQAWLETVDEAKLNAQFDPLDRVIWDAEDRMIAALAAHIRAHGMEATN